MVRTGTWQGPSGINRKPHNFTAQRGPWEFQKAPCGVSGPALLTILAPKCPVPGSERGGRHALVGCMIQTQGEGGGCLDE